jgi:hypothetical protein
MTERVKFFADHLQEIEDHLPVEPKYRNPKIGALAPIRVVSEIMDDFFLFHEDIGPDYLHIGEKVIVLFYLFLCMGFLLLNIREVLSGEFVLLGAALALFGISIFIDAVDLDEIDLYERFVSEQLNIFLEDGFKFVGVATWLAYFARYGYHKLVSRE